MNVPHIVYVLWSEKLKKRYVGVTANLESRLRDHNAGRSPFTRRGIPWKIVYNEAYPDASTSRQRERFLKSGAGRKWLDQLPTR